MGQIEMTTITLGDNKTLFVPLEKDGQTTALGFFVKKVGHFEGNITVLDVAEYVDETIPVVSFMFKTKTSINVLIKFLRFYRDNIYKK
jgi:hypothetical protein